MRITLDIDDELCAQALRLAGQDLALEVLIREALETFVRVQSARRLAALGGTTPEMKTTAPVDYEQDVNAWSNEQARLLRGRHFELLNIEHIANEIEGVGKREQHELASRMAALFAQLLKWTY